MINTKQLLNTTLLTSILAGLPIQQGLAQTNMLDTLTRFNNGLITSQNSHSLELNGVNSVATFQVGETIVLQVSHDPKKAYEMLINKTLMQGARINGLNFQTTFTLGVTKEYCDMHVFEDIRHGGYADHVQIVYKDQSGKLIQRHNISQKLCSTFS